MGVDRLLLFKLQLEDDLRLADYRCPFIESLKAEWADRRAEPDWTGRADELVGEPLRGEITAGEYTKCYGNQVVGELDTYFLMKISL